MATARFIAGKNRDFLRGAAVALAAGMTTSTESAQVFLSKLVSKAIQSEELAAAHYGRLAGIAPDEALEQRAIADARDEVRHAEALRRAALGDGIELPELSGWDSDFQEARAAFEACAVRGDFAACLFVQDVFLEAVAIVFYEVLAETARQVGAFALASLVDKGVVPDERLHMAHGLRDIVRRIPSTARAEAFGRAATAILPAMRVFADRPSAQPCAVTCRTCADHCLKVDACCGEVSLEGMWGRIMTEITTAVARVGVGVGQAAA
jgi:hypothetical protein